MTTGINARPAGLAGTVALAWLVFLGCAGAQKPSGQGWHCYTSAKADSPFAETGQGPASGCWREQDQCESENRTSRYSPTACAAAVQANCFTFVDGNKDGHWLCLPDAETCSSRQAFLAKYFGGMKAARNGMDRRSAIDKPISNLWDNSFSVSKCEEWK